jgi:hypothetical protein
MRRLGEVLQRRWHSSDTRWWRRPPTAWGNRGKGEAWFGHSRGGGTYGAHQGGGKTVAAAPISRETGGAPVIGLVKR